MSTSAGMADLIRCQRNTLTYPSTVVMSSNTHYVYAVVIVPKTGTIDRVAVAPGTVTGTPCTHRVGIEGVTTAGAPDGTYKGAGSAYADSSSFSSDTPVELTLGATASVTAGDVIAVTIRYQSGTIDASNKVSWNAGVRMADASGKAVPFFNGSPATSGEWGMPSFSIRYDDGTYLNDIAACSPTRAEWNSGSSPLYRGSLFTPTVECTLSAIRVCQRRAAGADYSVQVYLGSSSSPTVDQAVDTDQFGASAVQFSEIAIPATTISANQACRVIVKPTTVNNQNYFYSFKFASQAMKEAGVGKLSKTTASSPGTWTDTSDTVLAVFPVVTEFAYSSGGLQGYASA